MKNELEELKRILGRVSQAQSEDFDRIDQIFEKIARDGNEIELAECIGLAQSIYSSISKIKKTFEDDLIAA